jgi:hypothetical protein
MVSSRSFFVGCVCVLAGLAATVSGDTVQLVNGDNVSGKVLSLDAKQLKLKSDVFGELSIERSKIASIHLGDAAPAKPAPAPAAQVQVTVPQPNLDVINQLRSQGLDPSTLGDIKKAFPLLTQPGAGKYFDNAVSGLMSGKLDVGDIRKDAMKVVDEVKKLEKELGPQATQALRPYMSILENFIAETEPKKPAPPQPPAPPKK